MSTISADRKAFVTARQATRILGRGYDALYSLVKNGHIRVNQPPGLMRLYSVEDLQRLAGEARVVGDGRSETGRATA